MTVFRVSRPHSFAMIGRKAGSREAIEKMVPTGDSATIELNLELLISMENLFQKHSVRLRNGRR